MPPNNALDDRALVLRGRAWELRTQLWAISRIAAELRVSVPTVDKWLQKTRIQVADSLFEEAKRVQADQMYQLAYIADEALQAWHRSKESSKRVARVQGTKGDGSAGGGTTSQVAVDQDGDPRYLDVAMRAMSDIRKIVGAEAPVRTETTLRRGADELNDAELDQ